MKDFSNENYITEIRNKLMKWHTYIWIKKLECSSNNFLS